MPDKVDGTECSLFGSARIRAEALFSQLLLGCFSGEPIATFRNFRQRFDSRGWFCHRSDFPCPRSGAWTQGIFRRENSALPDAKFSARAEEGLQRRGCLG
jgi:hypothetical protein